MQRATIIAVVVSVVCFVVPVSTVQAITFAPPESLSVSLSWEDEPVSAGGTLKADIASDGQLTVDFTAMADNGNSTTATGTDVIVDIYKGEYQNAELYATSSYTYDGSPHTLSVGWDDPGQYFIAVYAKDDQSLSAADKRALQDKMRPWLTAGDDSGFKPEGPGGLLRLLGTPAYAQFGSPADDILWGKLAFRVEKAGSKPPAVAFLPGFQGSRLYEHGSGINPDDLDKRWAPSFFTDIPRLNLDKDGDSINDIRVGEPIDSIPFFGSVYGSFMQFLDQLEREGAIASWDTLPYDWRKAQDAVVREDIQYLQAGTYNMLERIEQLAAAANGGKVILIGHSNGGLVGKLLISALKEQGKSNLVKELIMIGTPQIGTPKSIPSILNGEGQARVGGLLAKRKDAVALAKNMPGVYGLLPSKAYFQTVADPVVKFGKDGTGLYTDAYGTSISSYTELDNFLRGKEGRQPSADLGKPIVANESVLSEAQAVQGQLDSWTAPTSTDVTEIIGWGLETIKSTRYRAYKDFVCDESLLGGSFDCQRVTKYGYKPVITRAGDGTVVQPSADYMSGDDYHLKLRKLSASESKNFEHFNMTETPTAQKVLKQVIQEKPVATSTYVKGVKPSPANFSDTLQLSVHSPVDISVTDAAGRTVQIKHASGSRVTRVQEAIPNARYLAFGEGKYIYLPANGEYDIRLEGTDTGTFTLRTQKITGADSVTASSTFADIPTTASTTASVTIDDNTLASSTLSVDYDGDGTDERTFSASSQGLFEKVLTSDEIPAGIKEALRNQLESFREDLQEGETKQAWIRYEQLRDFARNQYKKDWPQNDLDQDDKTDTLPDPKASQKHSEDNSTSDKSKRYNEDEKNAKNDNGGQHQRKQYRNNSGQADNSTKIRKKDTVLIERKRKLKTNFPDRARKQIRRNTEDAKRQQPEVGGWRVQRSHQGNNRSISY